MPQKKIYKVCVPITNRTNYSKLKNILRLLKSKKNIDLKIVLSSSIILEKYGNGYQDILKDGFDIEKKIDSALLNDSHEAMSKSVGLSMIEHSSLFQSIKPDVLIAVGDRYDMLPVVVSASMMNIPIFHIQGGETSGTIDNVIRDVISKFSSLHFVSSNLSLKKLEKIGINKNSIFNFGCPSVEYINSIKVGKFFEKKNLSKQFKKNIDIKPYEKYLLVMIHPDTTIEDDVNMHSILNVIKKINLKAFIFYPNIDANNQRILSAITDFKDCNLMYFIRHMPLPGFIHAMAHSSCYITNSSSGIREAASFGVPVLNIGNRQKDREKNTNVINTTDDPLILNNLIKKYINKRFKSKNIFFKKDCSKMICNEIINFLKYKL